MKTRKYRPVPQKECRNCAEKEQSVEERRYGRNVRRRRRERQRRRYSRKLQELAYKESWELQHKRELAARRAVQSYLEGR